MLFKKHPEELRLTGWWLILLLFLWIGSSSGDWVFKNHVLLISLSCDDYTCHDFKWNHANFIVWLSSVLILSIQVSHMTSCAHCSNAVWWPLGNHRSLSRNIGEWLLAVARLQRGCCTKTFLQSLPVVCNKVARCCSQHSSKATTFILKASSLRVRFVSHFSQPD